MPYYNILQGQDPQRPLGIEVGASSMPPPTEGVTKQAAPIKLRQALNRGVLRGSGGTQQQLVMVMYLNEYRTTLAQSASVKKNTACVPDAQRLECGMEPVERVGCRVCWAT